MATYGGANIFGLAVRILMEPEPSDVQRATFFGASGRYGIWGGNRGRTFVISGVLTGTYPADVAAARDLMLSYADGIARVLYDPVEDISWAEVVYTGAFSWAGPYGLSPNNFWARPYRAVFEGRI